LQSLGGHPIDSFGAIRPLGLGKRRWKAVDLAAAGRNGLGDIARLPLTRRILLENMLRHEDGRQVHQDAIRALATAAEPSAQETVFHPYRVLMQDYSGLAALIDLTGLRDTAAALGQDPDVINPSCPVDLVIDHSHVAEFTGSPDAERKNLAIEYERNAERYRFLRWAGSAFRNIRVVPPGKGIVHQVNLEHLATVAVEHDGWLFPDTVIGTDSHTTMVNGLGVLGWGVGGVEAEVVLLGHPLNIPMPQVTGVRLSRTLRPGILATDAVLEITHRLRAHRVTARFVEFYGPGVAALSVSDRATIANMAPEYGATSGLFPIDQRTLDYLAVTGRSRLRISLVETYARFLGLWQDRQTEPPHYEDLLEIDLGAIDRCVAGPRRPQDRLALSDLPSSAGPQRTSPGKVRDGDIVIAAITSCTNTANPAAMLTAGLIARRARECGLRPPPHVRTSLAPGSRAVASYLRESGLLEDLEAIGFGIVGYGCSTCVGNSGELPPDIAACIREHDLSVASMISGNRNFEGRIHPLVKLNYLASPPLVVAYALSGTVHTDPNLDALWPSAQEIDGMLSRLSPAVYRAAYEHLTEGDAAWDALPASPTARFPWSGESSYLKPPRLDAEPRGEHEMLLDGAHALLALGNSVTTDHISPVGRISPSGDAGRYLSSLGIAPADFNTYGARRGNADVMIRGTFDNPRLRNLLTPDHEGPVTIHGPSGELLSVFDASLRYAAEGKQTIIVAGRDYGAGSARDWAAKGTRFLGVRAVLAESFERIHRSNLALMGVLPLQLIGDPGPRPVAASDRFTIRAETGGLTGGDVLRVKVAHADGLITYRDALCRLDTALEFACYRSGSLFGFGRLTPPRILVV
jgi:aconitate hydratase